MPLLVSETSDVLGLISGSAGLVDFSVEPKVNPVGFALLSVVVGAAGPEPNVNPVGFALLSEAFDVAGPEPNLKVEAVFDELESEAANLKPDVVTDANAGFAADDPPKAGVAEALGLEPGFGSEQHTHSSLSASLGTIQILK